MKINLSSVTLNATLNDSDTYGKHLTLAGAGERQFMKGYGYKCLVTLEDGSKAYVRILDFASVKAVEGGAPSPVKSVPVAEAAKTAKPGKGGKAKKAAETAAPAVEESAALKEYREFQAFLAMKASASAK